MGHLILLKYLFIKKLFVILQPKMYSFDFEEEKQ